MEKLFWIFQVIFDVVVVILLFFIASRRRLEREDLERVLGTEERIRSVIEDRMSELKATCDMIAYEKEKAIEELNKKELEIERKLKLISDAVGRKEKERKQKRELVKHLLERGKSPAEISSELGIPVSEVKLIAELLSGSFENPNP